MFGAFVNLRRGKLGQAMVESTLSLVLILFGFLVLFNLSDSIRTKLLVEAAAGKCARARAVGYNDFQLRKIARLTLMPVSGRCLTENDSLSISYGERIYRIGPYLNSEYETQAAAVLDFEGWRNGGIKVAASEGSVLSEVNVEKLKPRIFDFSSNPDGSGEFADFAEIVGTGRCETHYTDYLQ